MSDDNESKEFLVESHEDVKVKGFKGDITSVLVFDEKAEYTDDVAWMDINAVTHIEEFPNGIMGDCILKEIGSVTYSLCRDDAKELVQHLIKCFNLNIEKTYKIT